ncbi:hypothetical protein LTR37_011129 [Vermiconidia calcicola]|uniref:Uncharacterized protein n=1 Tax=Vermiconidia calcicola TaxID=1690605 RepID=A0ACC3N4H4_9PEZI|nr:hypothetical protein LTR37_011129 [Vermiconidia calcicola]
MTNTPEPSDGVFRLSETQSIVRNLKSVRPNTVVLMAPIDGTASGIERILILGDNYAGSSILKALSRSEFEVHVAHPHALSRQSNGVTYHTHDLSESLKPLFFELKPHLVISTASGGSFETQKNIIDSTIEAGIPQFIPSEFGQDSLNTCVQERLPPSRERARVIKYLERQADDGHISWVAVATGSALDRGLLSGNLGFDLKWQSATLHGEGTERFAASSSAWIGRVVLAVIERWQEVKNQYLYVAGVTTSANEVIDQLEKITSKSFVAGRAEVEECVREAERRLEQGFPDAGMFLMERSVLYDQKIDAVRSFEESDAVSKLGLEKERIADTIKGVVHNQQHHGGAPGCGCD